MAAPDASGDQRLRAEQELSLFRLETSHPFLCFRRHLVATKLKRRFPLCFLHLSPALAAMAPSMIQGWRGEPGCQR